jgi:Mg/Co/Ni transporter MgtE
MRLRTSHQGLHRLRPGELADLLEDLGRPARQELLASLAPEQAADALEEMDPEELKSLLREAEPAQAAALLASMEPDEAVDALRDMVRDDRDEILALMPLVMVEGFNRQLGYSESQAGGFMTTTLVVVEQDEQVAEVCRRLGGIVEHRSDVDGIVVVDSQGALVADVALFDMLIANPEATMGTLVTEEEVVTIGHEASLAEVAAQLIESRRSSIVVVDDRQVPVGRILGDDVIDALMPERHKFHFPRLLR